MGRNSGQPVCAAYTAPFEFTGGTIAKVVVDVSGTPYIDRERELARLRAGLTPSEELRRKMSSGALRGSSLDGVHGC